MHEVNSEDIPGMKFLGISLIACKIRVGIIGGGKAAFIKALSIAGRDSEVEVLSPNFFKGFYGLKNENVKLITGEYETGFIKDKHLVIIAVTGEDEERIIKDCEKANKLYLVCSDFRKGNFIKPFQDNTKNIFFTVNTRGNPMGAVFLGEKVREVLKGYDDFMDFIIKVREKFRGRRIKKELMKYVNSEEFYRIFKSGRHEEVIKGFLKDEGNKGGNEEEQFSADTDR
ncbi:NAD(P)-dependent oxidoreductase [Thermovenabulum sp.]|uniref:NAD(P)-dependent oxidoreductase n=1 Tax=Thermovenabulum sp. TaxID=3100335 RepID=UPI003C7C2710